MIFSAIININADLISVENFFFTFIAPSKNPAFYLIALSFHILKTKLESNFIAVFGKIFGKKAKTLFSGC